MEKKMKVAVMNGVVKLGFVVRVEFSLIWGKT